MGHKRRPLTDAEVRRLLGTMRQGEIGLRDRALLYLMAYTGIREVEARRARICDLTETEQGWRELAVWGKGRQGPDESVYLVDGRAVDVMRAWLAAHPRGDEEGAPLFCGLGFRNTGGPLAARTVRYLLRQHLDMAEISDPRKTGHSLRHTAVTKALRNGATPLETMSMTRHKSLETLQIYAHDLERSQHPAEERIGYEK
jgi:integrase/recombinase XerD